MPKYVIDTNLYVEAITTDEGNQALAAFQRRFAPFLFQHSTVAQEILAGARGEAGYREYYDDWIAPFEELGRVITPSHESWARAALIMVRLVEKGKKSPGGFSRSFLNDCLIAASAREHGLVLVTRNTTDFGLIRQIEARLEYAPPWPGG
ncbi:MAG: type II toxin-antitoxin system VapC family toxin [Gemmatimonadetes bacterium]|nr:type II toxin-antitoxin system VapC family toxin [Gemmatimonadota bacterium]MBI2616066.1 type II toxin-antitoxin system VapC family toxin [Gemmatimonadota bacterium]